MRNYLRQIRLTARRRPFGNLSGRPRVGPLEVELVLGTVSKPRRPSAQKRRVASSREEALPDHFVAHQIGDAEARGTGAVDDHALVAHAATGRIDGGERRSHHYSRRALHVVIERARLIGVLVENSAGIARTEVLPVQHGVWEQLGRGGDVGVNQVVVALVAHAHGGFRCTSRR